MNAYLASKFKTKIRCIENDKISNLRQDMRTVPVLKRRFTAFHFVCVCEAFSLT